MKSKPAVLVVTALIACSIQLSPSAFAQGRGGGGGAGRVRARWNALSDSERSRVVAAHRNALSDPSVRAAHERLKQARREFRELMRPAMLKADPGVQPILEKMKPEKAKGE